MAAVQFRVIKSVMKDVRGTSEKMLNTLVSMVTKIRHLSLPSSNIPLVLSFTKMALITNQFPFRMHNVKIVK